MVWVLGLWSLSLDAGGLERASAVYQFEDKLLVGGTADTSAFLALLDTSGKLLGSWLLEPFESVAGLGGFGGGAYVAGNLLGGNMGLVVLDANLNPLWGVEFWLDSLAFLTAAGAGDTLFVLAGLLKEGGGFVALLNGSGEPVSARITPRIARLRLNRVLVREAAYVAGSVGAPLVLALDPSDLSFLWARLADTSGEFLGLARFEDKLMCLGWSLRGDTLPLFMELDTSGSPMGAGVLVQSGRGEALASTPYGPVGFGEIGEDLWAFRWGHSPEIWGWSAGPSSGFSDAFFGAERAWAVGEVGGDALVLCAYYTGNFCGSEASDASQASAETAPGFINLSEVRIYSRELSVSLTPLTLEVDTLCVGPRVAEGPAPKEVEIYRVFDPTGRLVRTGRRLEEALRGLRRGVYLVQGGRKILRVLRR